MMYLTCAGPACLWYSLALRQYTDLTEGFLIELLTMIRLQSVTTGAVSDHNGSGPYLVGHEGGREGVLIAGFAVVPKLRA